jgi:hypothetical protein
MSTNPEPGRTYRLTYDDHLGRRRSTVGRVLKHFDAAPADFIFPGRPRPIPSVEVEVTPEKVGSYGLPTVLNIAVQDIVSAAEVGP